MTINVWGAGLALAISGFTSTALAQGSGEEPRGSTPPGSARDGSRPSDGAITGGSIQPGESSGVPKAPSPAPSDRADNRCNELSGSLREECLLKAQGAAAGGTSAPDTGNTGEGGPRVAPPPQNPR